MFACEMPPFRSVRVPFALLLPRGATRREARRGLAALTITDDRRVDAGAADVRVGDVKCAMTITNDR